MTINKRLLKMMLRRAIYIPKGLDFFRYVSNRINYHIQSRRHNPVVNHPVSLMIELTNHCQLKCITCARESHWGKQMSVGHMDFDQFKRIVDENHAYLDGVALTGLGETLLYPRIVEAVDYIGSKSKGILIFISTNAYQRNAPDLIEEIAGRIDTLQISLDGIGSTFEGIRKGAKFDRYYSNLERISRLNHKSRMSVKFNMVVFKKNFKDMVNVVELANDLSVQEIFFSTVNLAANDSALSEYDFFVGDEFRDEFNRALSKAGKLGIHIGYRSLDAPKGFRFCGYPWDRFYITWDGYSVPCCAKPFPKELNFGSVFEEGLLPVLNSEGFQAFRRMSKENRTPDFCRRCHMIDHHNVRRT